MKTRRVVDVDDRGRVSLAKYGLKNTQVVIDEEPDGTLHISQPIVLTTSEIARLFGEEHASAVERGLRDVVEGRVFDVLSEAGELRIKPSI